MNSVYSHDTLKSSFREELSETSSLTTASTSTVRCLWFEYHINVHNNVINKGKGKGFPYSTPSVGPGADPDVQAVSLQVTVSHTPGGRLPVLSARPAVTSPAAEHHRPLAGTKLYCFW